MPLFSIRKTMSEPPSKLITCNIMGGLGNQLFQIATTIAYAIQNKCIFVFPYSVEVFKNRFSYWHSFLVSLRRFTTENPKFGKTNLGLDALPKYFERGFHFNPLPAFEVSVSLQGYFQSYLYFDKEKESFFKFIRLREQQEKVYADYTYYFTPFRIKDAQPVKLFSFNSALEEGVLNEKRFIPWSEEKEQNPITVSLHFRLGDYHFLPDFHPILSPLYYENALVHLLSKLPPSTNKNNTVRILYFCEEKDHLNVLETIEYLKRRLLSLPYAYNVVFVKVADEIEDWKQMLLMSLCDHHIIANSTFSWWGAYFHYPSKEHYVIYPSVWFGPKLQDKNVSDLFPKSWIKITY